MRISGIPGDDVDEAVFVVEEVWILIQRIYQLEQLILANHNCIVHVVINFCCLGIRQFITELHADNKEHVISSALW